MKVTYTDTDYSAYEYIDFFVNSSIINIDTNNITTSLTSNGKFGFESYYPKNGIGFIYKDQYDILYEMGLMISANGTIVSDCVRGGEDFEMQSKAEQIIPAQISDFDVNTIFNDILNSSPIGVNITQNTFAWDNTLAENFIVVKYDIINNNAFSIDSFYLGLFADWDIVDYAVNTVGFDQNMNISYTNSGEGTDLYAGIQLLSGGTINHYAIDNVDGGAGGINIYNSFSDSDKIIALSTNRHNAGPNDVCDVLSSGPHNIIAGDTLSIAFAIHANIHLPNLLSAADYAQSLYDSLFSVGINEIAIDNNIKVYPNPSKGIFTVVADNAIEIKVIDSNGKTVFIKNNVAKKEDIDLREMPKGIYILKIITDNTNVLRKIVIE